jgi:hypothetical protein
MMGRVNKIVKLSKYYLIAVSVALMAAHSPAFASEKQTPRSIESAENRTDSKAPQKPAAEQQVQRRKTRCISCRILM